MLTAVNTIFTNLPQGLAALLREIFIIGSESESVMMRWSVRILSCHPEVQKKVADEIERVVGKGIEVTWDKRKSLPYTMAVIKVNENLLLFISC